MYYHETVHIWIHMQKSFMLLPWWKPMVILLRNSSQVMIRTLDYIQSCLNHTKTYTNTNYTDSLQSYWWLFLFFILVSHHYLLLDFFLHTCLEKIRTYAISLVRFSMSIPFLSTSSESLTSCWRWVVSSASWSRIKAFWFSISSFCRSLSSPELREQNL